jgi:hypothetical protein
VKAIIALEHVMLIAFWNMLTTGAHYDDPGGDFYTRLDPDRAKLRALDQVRNMATQSPSRPRPPRDSESSHQG